MTSIDKDVHYAPIPTQPTDPNVVVLTFDQTPPPSRHTRLCICLCLSSAVVILFLAAAVFFLYPSDPEIQLVRIKLNHIQVHSSNKLLLNLSFSLTIKVRNKDFLSLQYDSLVVSIDYRGEELGFVRSDGGRVKARGTSYVNATLDLNGLEIIHDVIYFLEDLAKGVIPFDTDTKVRGNLGLLFFKFPFKATVTCEVYVDVSDQTVSPQNCSSALSDRQTERFEAEEEARYNTVLNSELHETLTSSNM